ncbi:hypothetical protein AK812_SmicGene39397 [Symbiodinium microadriaticum]|uniref:Uncharacterized protein n=1 Tax=Symbiodinium microadriaticum TaxID=2951 RepID=A0A1Q9CBC2_SYMMI|nr:hypothetical protein AK812_SmicGene39397 [Symbiodinium microadriaticum]CAE7525032.1 unnamed protein product [Symbiodinium microadriaticum]
MFFSIKFEAKCAEQGFSVVASETTSLTMFKARGKRGSKLLQTKTSPEPIDGQGHRQSGSSLGLPFLADVARVDGLESREGGPRSTQIAFILTPEMLQISRGLTLLTKHGFPVLTQVLHSTGRLSDDYAILQFLDLRGSFVTPQQHTETALGTMQLGDQQLPLVGRGGRDVNFLQNDHLDISFSFATAFEGGANLDKEAVSSDSPDEAPPLLVGVLCVTNLGGEGLKATMREWLVAEAVHVPQMPGFDAAPLPRGP